MKAEIERAEGGWILRTYFEGDGWKTAVFTDLDEMLKELVLAVQHPNETRWLEKVTVGWKDYEYAGR